MMDSGYDSKEIYETLRKRQVQAIIPLNLRGEKVPPEGLDVIACLFVPWGIQRCIGEQMKK